MERNSETCEVFLGTFPVPKFPEFPSSEIKKSEKFRAPEYLKFSVPNSPERSGGIQNPFEAINNVDWNSSSGLDRNSAENSEFSRFYETDSWRRGGFWI